MNERRKMPDGQRETSPRSSASKSEALILVFSEIDFSRIWRRWRSFFRRTHSDVSEMLSSGFIGCIDASCKFSSGTLLHARGRIRIVSIHVEGRNCAIGLVLLRSDGGTLTLPNRESLLVSREDGGNLVVNPP